MLENSGLHQLTGKIDSIEVATRAIKGCSTAIYILAGMDILASIILKGSFAYYIEGFL